MSGATLAKADITAFLADGATKEITNVHATTWTYETDDPTRTDYINQLSGSAYYTDFEPGGTNVNFSIGQYDYQTKADLQGGTATATSWVAPLSQGVINKAFLALTKDDTYIFFPKAAITARAGMVEDKLIGLLFSASPNDPGVAGMASEIWCDL
jgi:hypothetical protein